MSSPRWKTLAIAAVVGSLALAGCANNATGNSAGGATDSTGTAAAGTGTPDLTIMIGGMSKTIYLPYTLAQQLGYYDKAGVSVNMIDEPAGGDATTNMLAGQVQGVGGFYDHTIVLQGKGKATESVISMLQNPGEVELCRTDLKDQIKTPADWAGRSLGITGVSPLLWTRD